MMTSFVACVSMPIGSHPDLGPSSLSVALQTRYFGATLKNTRGYENQDAFGRNEHTYVVADPKRSTSP